MPRLLLFALLAFLAPKASAQMPAGPAVVLPGEMEWKAPGSLPPGVEFHAVYENKQTRAIQTLVRFAKGLVLPAHTHTHDETILVVKGKLSVELGGVEKVLVPGAYAFFPAGTAHTLRAKGWGSCEFLVSLSGPFDILGLPSVR
jgi:quercetin dioxygenase-like cupin family protein